MNDSKMRRLRDRSSGPATLISEGCKITGTLAGDGDFMISGEIEGDCELRGTVTLTHKGYWKGKLEAAAVIVAGRVDGDVVCSGRIEISNTAKISGTVTGAAIAVAEGAIVQGTMKTTAESSPVEFTEKRIES